MKTVYFVRHGETDGNKTNMYQHVDISLSDLGRKQAEFVAERFTKIPVDALICSDMQRAKETAEIIGKKIGLQREIVPFFHEMMRPTAVRGRSKTEHEVERIIALTDKHWDDPTFKHSDEENFFDVKTRGLKALSYLVNRPEERILVVTHGLFLNALFTCMLMGDKLTPNVLQVSRKFMTSENTGITVCYWSENSWHVRIWNDHAHLG